MDTLQQQSFDLGWDYATFEMNVPDQASKIFCDGYRAFTTSPNKSRHMANKYVRKWLQIRFGALCRGKQFSLAVTPEYLEKITPASGKCPVTGAQFTFGTLEHTDWSVDRANNERGYVCGNLIIVSRGVNSAKSDKSLVEIRALAQLDESTVGLTPVEWTKLAQLIEPAFGDYEDDANPVHMLFGQPVALGMPVSPLAGFQIALSRAFVEVWDQRKHKFMNAYITEIYEFLCRTRQQRKAFRNLTKEVARRSQHIQSYAEIWATGRVQKRLITLVNTLDNAGMSRLVELQQRTVGDQNTKIA
jgi:hypothetical protein